ncbi:MAG: two-component sensor histidine kinase [Alphaproteobacteria bacterium]|nr:two-component sensor histidine kinase [Alphaproteobacteria bacterium]
MTNKIKNTLLILSQLFQWMKWGLKKIRSYIIPQSLMKRFLLIILLPLILLQAVIIIFFYERHWEVIAKRLALDVVGEIQIITNVISHEPSQETLNTILLDMDKYLSLKVNWKPHQIIEENKNAQKTPYFLNKSLKTLPYPYTLQENNDRSISISIQLPNGLLTTVVPKKRYFTSTIFVFLLWLIGTAILLFGIAFLFIKNQVRSIERLSRASELMGRGHMNFTFNPSGATEVKQAGYSFIMMKDRIQKYLKERTDMLAGVSHDLRTPLTRMKLQLSMMEQDENIKDLQSDIDEMEKMLTGYLSFAKGEGKEAAEPIVLNLLVEDIVQKLKKTGQKIDLHTEQKIEILGRSADLTRAITNILTNAGRYATYAQVNLGIRNKMATIIIDDNGPGIPESKRKEVFKAFYRLENSRNKETGGVGLGMTIARDVVLSHGGDIVLKTSPLKGLRVVISLPQKFVHKK